MKKSRTLVLTATMRSPTIGSPDQTQKRAHCVKNHRPRRATAPDFPACAGVPEGDQETQTHAEKVHLVGHSLGGVVTAQAIASGRLTGKVDTVITLGSPFGGSPWAHLLPFGPIIPELREGSPLLRRLASAPIPDGVRWLAFTATLDIIVPGLRSVPPHPQVETITVGGVGHLGMLLSRQVVGRIVAALPA